MAATSRRSYASLIEALRAAPERFDFIQAVRLLERAAAGLPRDGRESREAVPGLIGMDSDPRSEALRLRAALELAFPATEIAAFDDSGKKPELTVTMLGLIGVSGVLPGHYSRLVLEASRDNNTAPKDFFNMFNHRALSLFVRAAEKYRLPLAFERSRARGTDSISAALLGLIGMRGGALQRRQGVRDETLVFYAGHFARRVRTADALRQMLSEHFDWPVGITQFQGHWANLLRGEQTQIGGSGADSRYATLGSSAILGTRVWDVQGSFRVKLGPLDYAQFHSFLPDASRMAELAALTRTYVGAALSFDVQLTLKGSEVPPLVLSAEKANGPRLGWNTWLPTQGPRSDARDAIFQGDRT
jgi:type VI secretion system protein ImpH